MTSKIRVLDDLTINKIAAGEVIENPSSVVKELVENAIDAGSTEITIEIKGGGRQLIRISDNGCGMNRDDALLSLERHATSKLREIDEIHSLNTMGFRGEAVPSIASISKLMILTSPGKSEEGTMVLVDGGKIQTCSPAVRTQGTTIEVKNLFFNVPARKKFQRSPNSDAAEVLKVVTALSLGYPEIRFTLRHNDENLLTASKEDRIKSVLGESFYQGLCQVSHERGELKIEGFIGLPTFTRHNRTGQHLFINRRSVVSPQVSYAIKEGYGHALSDHRHPVYVLYLTLPGSLVDVNVHPQKKEVRLRQDVALKEFISEAIDKALKGIKVDHLEPSIIPNFLSEASGYCLWQGASEDKNDPVKNEPLKHVQYTHGEPLGGLPARKDCIAEPVATFFVPQVEIPRVIFTLKGYIVLESKNGSLRLLDQRSAHERVIFERLLKAEGPVEVQTLLIPQTFDVSAVEREILKEYLPLFQSIGIQIEEFGQNSFIVQGISTLFSQTDVTQLIQEVVSEQSALKTEKQRVVARAASRASISKKAQLSLQEAHALVSQLMKCDKPGHCPQGKPTMIEMTAEDIAKQFQK